MHVYEFESCRRVSYSSKNTNDYKEYSEVKKILIQSLHKAKNASTYSKNSYLFYSTRVQSTQSVKSKLDTEYPIPLTSKKQG